MSGPLALLGATLTLIGGFFLYARMELFDPEAVGERAGSALADEEVRVALAPIVAAAIGQVSPEGEPSSDEVESALADPRVELAFGIAATEVAGRVYGKGSRLGDLDLSGVSGTAIEVSEGASLTDLGISEDDLDSAGIDLGPGRTALDALSTVERLGWLGLVLTPLGLLALLGRVLSARTPLRGLAGAGVALALAAVVGFVVLLLGRELVAGSFDDEGTSAAVAGAWDALFGGLTVWIVVVGAISIAVAIVAGLASTGSSRRRAYARP